MQAHTLRVAYQGEAGAFSEETALAAMPGAQTQGFDTFDAAAQAVACGDADAVCLPVENTLFGSIGRAYELLHHFDLWANHARIARIRQCLIARSATPVESICSVASHPVALEQCRSLFAAWPRMKPVVVHDTAGAVRSMMDGSLAADACIASEFAAKRYAARVVLHDVHDDPSNYTRFFVAVRRDAAAFPVTARTTDAIVGAELANRPGALRDALTRFADAGVNLTNLVCRPIPSRPWSYRFFFELAAGAATAHRIAQSIAALGDARVYGCYETIG